MSAPLKSYIDRILNVLADIDNLGGDKKEIYKELAGDGYDRTVVSQVVGHIRKKAAKPGKFAEQSALFDLYLTEYEGVGTVRANAHAAREPEWQSPRVASLGDQKDAYRAGRPISQDFRFENANVYFFAFPKLGRVKIGVTNDVEDRLQAIEKETGAEGFVLHFRPGNRQAEMAMHERFSRWHIEGEWFDDCRELRAELSDITEPEAAMLPQTDPVGARNVSAEQASVESSAPIHEPVAIPPVDPSSTVATEAGDRSAVPPPSAAPVVASNVTAFRTHNPETHFLNSKGLPRLHGCLNAEACGGSHRALCFSCSVRHEGPAFQGGAA